MVKNTLKTTLLIILAWLILPTGDPSDFIITAAIINAIGLNAYLVLSVVFIIFLYNNIQGRTITDKFNTVRREIRRLIKW